MGEVSFAMTILSEEDEDDIDDIDDRAIPNVVTATVFRSTIDTNATELDTTGAQDDPNKLRAYVVLKLGKKEMSTSLQKRMERGTMTKSEWDVSADQQKAEDDDDVSETGGSTPDDDANEFSWQWMEDIRYPCMNPQKTITASVYVVPASFFAQGGGEEEPGTSADQKREQELKNAASFVGFCEQRVSDFESGKINTLQLKPANQPDALEAEDTAPDVADIDDEELGDAASKFLGSIDMIITHSYDPNPPKEPESNAISVSPDSDEGDVEETDPQKSLFEDTHLQSETQKEEQNKKIEEAESVSMKEGDYSVIVHIIEARELRSEASKGANDPMITVSVRNF